MNKQTIKAPYIFAGIDMPIGISSYELTRALLQGMQSALSTIEQIEAELGKAVKLKRAVGRKKKVDNK